MKHEDRFYFYNSSIGDLRRLIEKYQLSDQIDTVGFITNAFGVKIRPKFFPYILQDRLGVEPPPIPANWHADIAEFGSALRAVDLAEKDFSIIELGCGWGCWLNITGVVAKRKGLKVNLIGVEGDKGHLEFALESLEDNNFDKSEYTIHRGIASSRSGTALFPIQTEAGESWGLEPVFDASSKLTEKFLSDGSYEVLNQISLDDVAGNRSRIDLLHIDIQGGEIPLLPDSIDFLNKKVAMILIGTHSRPIEGKLFDLFSVKGWVLEVERPAELSIGKKIETIVDGVQLWRNPHLISDAKAHMVDTKGSVQLVNYPKTVNKSSEFDIEVNVVNNSGSDWISDGDYPVRLSYHWMLNDQTFDQEGTRTAFKNNQLSTGSLSKQNMKVRAPNAQGQFQLVVTVVQDGIRWFDSTEFLIESVNIVIE